MHMLSTTLLLQYLTLYVALFPQISQRARPRRIIQAVGPQEGTNFGTKPKPVPFLRSHAGKSDRKIYGWDFLLHCWSLWQPYIYLRIAASTKFNSTQQWEPLHFVDEKSPSWRRKSLNLGSIFENFLTLTMLIVWLNCTTWEFTTFKVFTTNNHHYPHDDDDDDDHLHVNSVACKWSKLWLGASKSGAWHLLMLQLLSSSSLL